MAREAGASYCLVGHSERRDIFEETDDTARHKCRAALRAQMTPLLCVGEARSERVEGRTADVVGRQIRTVITNLDASQIGSMMFAYEPLWAIGTGDSASPQDAASVHQHIRFLLRQAAGPTVADGVPILYGGSVRPGNAAELLNATDVDGLLVGGASLKEESWLEIVGA
jgi:triosephosphate isomerase